ncbi:MAG: DnaD domain protein [Bacilli bacterium]|nr:DnaD domain protein [Bacilli bacterium]
MHTILPADTFIVVNKTVLHNSDRKILNLLYQPLVGNTAISLYFTLWSYLDKYELLSQEWAHNHILNNMMITVNEFDDARVKLEALSLIKTYVKKGNINSYVYELYSPLSASAFINNPLLSTALYNNIGKVEYEKIISYFSLPKLNLREYEDITSKFSDIFAWSSEPISNNIIHDLKKSRYRTLEILMDIDINVILSLIPEDILNHKSITKEVKELIYKVSYIYNYDNQGMVELIRNSIDVNHRIDKKLLMENASKYYSFENMGKLPSLIYKNQPEYLRKKINDNSNRSKMIYMFETTSPYDFIRSKYKTGNPSNNDLKIIAYLMVDLDLKPGVVNVLIDYILKINNNKLTKNYVETIASQWKKSNLETVEDAMNFAESEYKKRKGIKKENSKETKKITPKWLDQAIEEEMASEEDIKALEERLKRK